MHKLATDICCLHQNGKLTHHDQLHYSHASATYFLTFYCETISFKLTLLVNNG